ncbi:MAG: hypothetical protein QJR02_10285 [Sinobacteraceae bacterium]|nr:hypothetical protein [Nevskiaceae bacterium]
MKRTEVVTIGLWEDRQFNGLVVDGRYYSKGEARTSESAEVRREYWRARRAIRNSSYSLEDAASAMYEEGGVKVWHHELRKSDL